MPTKRSDPRTKIKNRLVKLLCDFKSARTIQAQYGISRETVAVLFTRTHAKLPPREAVALIKKIKARKLDYVGVRRAYGDAGLQSLKDGFLALRHVQAHDKYKNIVECKSKNPEVTAQELAKQFNIAPTSVSYAWHTAKSTCMPRSSSIRSTQKRNTIIRLYNSGMSTLEIAKLVHMGRNTVNAVLHNSGYDRKKLMSPHDVRRIYFLRKKGLSWKEVGYIFNRLPGSIAGTYRNVITTMAAEEVLNAKKS